MFMGTPHQGSHLAKWGSALGRLIPDNIRTVNRKAIEVLKKDSEVCWNLENAFQEQAKNGKFRHVKLFSFYETIALNGLGGMIVPEMSAVLRGDFKCPIHGTHKSMVRFEGRDDDGYCKVKGQLVAWVSPKGDAPGKEAPTRKTRKKRNSHSITQYGATFNGNVSSSTIGASQYGAGRNIYYHSGDQPETEEESSPGSDKDEVVD
jgi:hypothetical protein